MRRFLTGAVATTALVAGVLPALAAFNDND